MMMNFLRSGSDPKPKKEKKRGEERLEKTLDQAFLNRSPASLLDVNYYSLQLKNFVLSHILVLFSVQLNGKLFICSNHSGVRIFGMQVTILIAWRVVF